MIPKSQDNVQMQAAGIKFLRVLRDAKSRNHHWSRLFVLAGCPDKLLVCRTKYLSAQNFKTLKLAVKRFSEAEPPDPAPASECSTSASRSVARQTATARQRIDLSSVR